jgi:putative transcriptional regulator
MKKIRCRLKDLMAKQNPPLSQYQLAKETELSVNAIGRLYKGEFERIDCKTAETLCNYFGCDLCELFSFEADSSQRVTGDEIRKQYAAGERDFSRIDLTKANLSGIKLTEVVLTAAILKDASLSNADLSQANLDNADLREAKLKGADPEYSNPKRGKAQ